MKKFFRTPLIIFIIIIFTSCGQATLSQTPDDTIAPAVLTEEQREILAQLSIPGMKENIIFDYKTTEKYKSVDVWVEVYENGSLVAKPVAARYDSRREKARKGRITISVNQLPEYQWALSIFEDGVRTSDSGLKSELISVDPALARAYGPIKDQEDIADGKEIIIYSAIFFGEDDIAYNEDTLRQRPDLLMGYPCAHVVKCKFSKE